MSRTIVCAIAALAVIVPNTVLAQRAVEALYGRWLTEGPANLYGFSLTDKLVGPLHYGIGFVHVDDRDLLTDRSQAGGEFTLSTNRRSGLYALVGVGIAGRYADGQVAGSWSAGVGYGLRLLSRFSVAIEGRYRAEDEGLRGFWRLRQTDRRALTLSAHVRFYGGLRAARPAAPVVGASAPLEAVGLADVTASASDGVLSEASARTAVSVVETALSAMGTPYRWGGGGEKGFDCSGLIQYAYGEHGIILPRVSRDQARTGMVVPRQVAALRPGDILTFSESGSGVSHVGLYVGEGQFLHSASTGVKLSSLTVGGPDTQWWRDRWVGARRVLP